LYDSILPIKHPEDRDELLSPFQGRLCFCEALDDSVSEDHVRDDGLTVMVDSHGPAQLAIATLTKYMAWTKSHRTNRVFQASSVRR
jgi:hypothetical protein